MTQVAQKGHFYVGELPDGKFVAASNFAPYFCFRADSEDAVLAKVTAALTYYFDSVQAPPVPIQRPTSQISHWKSRRAVPLEEYVHAAA